MIIKLDQFDIQTAIDEYLERRGIAIGECYSETSIKHTRKRTKAVKGVSKNLKKNQTYEFFWYSNGHPHNDEEIEFMVFLDK